MVGMPSWIGMAALGALVAHPTIAARVSERLEAKSMENLIEWRVGRPPASGCGWAELECWRTNDGMLVQQLPKETCKQMAEFKQIPMETKFRGEKALWTESCPETTLKSICLATVNYAERDVQGANDRAQAVVNGCDGADIIVFASQELSTRFNDNFRSFARNLFTTVNSTEQYIEVGRCGGRISTGVVVHVRASVRSYVADFTGECRDETTGAEFAFTNYKGSTIFQLFTVLGPLVAASTHGARGGVESANRVAGVVAAAQEIVQLKPTLVAWGGDFNVRTDVSKFEDELLYKGITHPPKGQDGVDEWAKWAPRYDPEAVYELLAKQPDDLGDGRTLQQVLDRAVGARGVKLAEVPGLRRLCPSYRKADPGHFESKGSFSSMFSSSAPKWVPSLACRAPGMPGVEEYFLSPEDGKTKWSGSSSRAPSWTERLITHAGASCQQPQKAWPGGRPIQEDHDVVFARCSLA